MMSLRLADDCNRCDFRETCDRVVWGVGSRSASLMFVGEAPDDEDDLMGEPFSGRPGDYLRKLLIEAEINPEDCYFTHTIKCKQPKRIRITKRHTEACTWLRQELDLIKPKVVVALGQLPISILLGTKRQICIEDVVAKATFWKVDDVVIAPWFHPNWILANGKAAHGRSIDFLKKVKDASQ